MKLHKKVVDTFWNSMGSAFFAAVSFLLLICVTREYGVAKAGSFGVAITTAQLMYRVGVFAMRQYQITDLNDEFSFATYCSAKIVTTLFSFSLFSIYMILNRAAKSEFWQFFWIFLFYQILSVDDLFQNRFFQKNRLDKAGKSKCLVIGGYLGSFLILLNFNLELNTILVAALFMSLIISIINCPASILQEMSFLRDSSVFQVIKMAFPAFVSNFLFAFINGLPKYTVYYFCSREESGYINNIFILLNVVELVGNFIYYPFIPDITKDMRENPKRVRKLILRISVVVIAFGCAIAVFINAGGNILLELIYHRDFTMYVPEMTYTISVCGVFVALVALFYWIPVILRNQTQLFWIFGGGTVVAVCGCIFGTLRFGILGAIVGHSLAVGGMAVLLLRFFLLATNDSAKNDKRLLRKSGTV